MDDIRDQVHTMRLFTFGWSDRDAAGMALTDVLSKAINAADAAIDEGRRDDALGYVKAAEQIAGEHVREGYVVSEEDRLVFHAAPPLGAGELMTEETADALRDMLHDYWRADERLLQSARRRARPAHHRYESRANADLGRG